MHNWPRTPESYWVWKELLLFHKRRNSLTFTSFTSIHWSLSAIASPEHTGALLKTGPAPAGRCSLPSCPEWSKHLLKRIDVSSGALLQLFSIYMPTYGHFSPTHTHCAKTTEPRGVQFINHTLCQKQPTSVDSEPFGSDLIIRLSLLKVNCFRPRSL